MQKGGAFGSWRGEFHLLDSGGGPPARVVAFSSGITRKRCDGAVAGIPRPTMAQDCHAPAWTDAGAGAADRNLRPVSRGSSGGGKETGRGNRRNTGASV